MSFQVSPGVNVTEVDLTTIVPAVATTTGALAGVFNWGPVDFPTQIINETKLVRAAVYLLHQHSHEEIVDAIKQVKLNMIR